MKTYFFLILCVLFWSGNFILGRYINEEIEPLELAFFRWFFVLIIVSPILILKFTHIYQSIKNNYFILLFLSALGISTYNTFVYIALTMTTSTNALIINSIVPILILLLSVVVLKQKILTHQIIGILLSTLGVLFLVLKGDFANIFSLNFNNGDLTIIISALSWAFYSTFVKFRPKELNNYEFFATIVLLGFIILLPFYLYQGYTVERELYLLKSNYLIFLYISIFASCLSYYFWHFGIDHIGASKTGQFVHLMPLFGTILAYVFLEETLLYYHISGAFAIALGIYLSLFYKRVQL